VLELLNTLLSAGEVPGLWTPEELAKELVALDAKRDADTHYQARCLDARVLLHRRLVCLLCMRSPCLM
jgi:hypothetical protein